MLARLKSAPHDEGAWGELYSKLWPFVMAVTYRRLGGVRDLAEDAAQETFLRVLRAAPFARLADADALRAYLWRAADNTARSHRARCLRHAALNEDEGTRREPSAAIAAEPPGSVERELHLRAGLERLSGIDREIASMTAEGYSLRDIAEATGLSYNAAAVRLHRLRKRLDA